MNQILVCSILPQFVEVDEIEAGVVVVDVVADVACDTGSVSVAGVGDPAVVAVAVGDCILMVLHVFGAHVLESAQLNTE